MYRLKPSVFKHGKLLLKESLSIPIEGRPVDTTRVYKTRNGKFKFLNRRECLFCPKFVVFALYVHTPFPVKGRVLWKNGLATVEGRIPLGSTVFFGAWLAGWTAGGLMLPGSESGSIPVALGVVVLGWLFAGVGYFFSVSIERRRAHRIVDDIREHVTATTGGTEPY